MKIIGGQFKGRNFYMPNGIRPTQSIAREAVFDMLGQDMTGLTFLDLFSGSGAVGLEAYSRDAQRVILVEKDSKCVEVIKGNIELLSGGSDAAGTIPIDILQTDVFAAIKMFARQERKFDIIFVDPPFGLGLAKKALKTLEAYDILQPNCTVVIQHEKREILPQNKGRFLNFRQKKYGSSIFSIYS